MAERLFILVSLCTCLLAAGCDDSKNPLSDPQTAKLNSDLTGTWRSREEYRKGVEVTYVHTGTDADGLPCGVMRVALVTHDRDGTMRRPSELLAFSTRIGANTYLNVTPVDDERLNLLKKKGWNAIDGYLLFRYKVEGDTLVLWKMDSDAKQRAIEDKKVNGEIKEGFLLDMNRFTDTSENIARLVANNGEKLFATKEIQLERVK